MDVTPDHIVRKIGFHHQEFGVDRELKNKREMRFELKRKKKVRVPLGSYLQYVVSRLDIGDVDPLTVNISIVSIIATWAQTLSKQTSKSFI